MKEIFLLILFLISIQNSDTTLKIDIDCPPKKIYPNDYGNNLFLFIIQKIYQLYILISQIMAFIQTTNELRFVILINILHIILVFQIVSNRKHYKIMRKLRFLKNHHIFINIVLIQVKNFLLLTSLEFFNIQHIFIFKFRIVIYMNHLMIKTIYLQLQQYLQ